MFGWDFSISYFPHFAYFDIKKACPELLTDPSCLICGWSLTESENMGLLILMDCWNCSDRPIDEIGIIIDPKWSKRFNGPSWVFSEGHNFIIFGWVLPHRSMWIGGGMSPQTDSLIPAWMDREGWKKVEYKIWAKSLTPSKSSKPQRPSTLYILVELNKKPTTIKEKSTPFRKIYY